MRDMTKQVDNALLVPVPNKSRHNLDAQVLTTSAFGRLTPTFLMEAVPGGVYNLEAEILVRFQPITAPLMHKAELKTFYFYIPYRILWNNWEYYIRGAKDPLTGLDPVHPYYTANYLYNAGVGTNIVSNNRLADYFGLKTPTVSTGLSNLQLNPFPFIAYQSVWNRYFRHKVVDGEIDARIPDGVISESNFNSVWSLMRQITYEDDYFNSMLPTPQAIAPALIDDKAVVKHNASGTNPAYGLLYQADAVTQAPPSFSIPRAVTTDPDLQLAANQLYADVTITVEEIRRASALQRFLEVSNSVSGSYIDYHKAFFNVDIPDSRVQEPEYICGTSSPIIISDVVNMDSQLGKWGGTAATYAKSGGGSYTALEHGLIMGISVVTYKPVYYHARQRLHFKTDKFDYLNPQFDMLGEQATYHGEIMPISQDAKTTYGYLPKHFEYRASFDYITGEMATQYHHWHLARNYTTTASLTASFFKVLDERRIFQVTDTAYDPIIFQVYNNVSALLPVANLGEPQVL